MRTIAVLLLLASAAYADIAPRCALPMLMMRTDSRPRSPAFAVGAEAFDQTDALGARRIGSIAWPICQRLVADAHLVDDAAILAAQRQLWNELRLAVEPAAALPLAALRSGVVRPAAHERVALVLCGANLDPASLD